MSTTPNLNAHLATDRYGEFHLTQAIRPDPALGVIPRQGYRRDVFRDPETGERWPMLTVAVSREQLFEVFLDLLEPLGAVVDAVLETSHEDPRGAHRDCVREHIDLPILQSHFWDFEELLLDDGCTGVAVISQEHQREVQFDEHKLIRVYSRDLRPFEAILARWHVARDDRLKFLSEAEHLHRTRPQHADEFEQFACRLGVEELVESYHGE
jgi:hypothetical protein